MSGEVDDGDQGGAGDDGRAAVEAEARALGWSDRSHWRGPPEEFREAEEFVRRGKEIVPFIRHNNEKLSGALAQANAQIAALKGTVQQQAASVQSLIEHQEAEIQRQVTAKLKTLKADKIAALKDGDHALAAALEEEIDIVKEEAETAKATKPAPKTPPTDTPTLDPGVTAFAEENKDWLNEDTKENKKNAKLFMALCETLHAEGLRGRPLLEEGKKQLNELLQPAKRPTPKSEGGGGGWGGGGSGGGSSGDGTSFADLPADAKAMARKQEKTFVGPKGSGKAFETAAAWHDHYAKTYFASTKR